MKNRYGSDAGFTLLEVVIIVAVMAILAAAITPSLLRQIVDAKVLTTRASARAIYEGMVGKADTKGSYGFLGDMGRLPTEVKELVFAPNGAMPAANNRNFRGVTMGWNGPYLTVGESRDDIGKDAWNNEFRLVGNGQVRSAGPDGVFDDEDDIVYPTEAPKLGGRVLVSVKRLNADAEPATADPTGYEVRLYYAANGQETSVASAMAPFAFDNVYPGLHAIAVVRSASGQIVAQETIEVIAGGTKLVELTFRP